MLCWPVQSSTMQHIDKNVFTKSPHSEWSLKLMVIPHQRRRRRRREGMRRRRGRGEEEGAEFNW